MHDQTFGLRGNTMKIYGYGKNSSELIELSEASIVASAAELNELVRLLQEAIHRKKNKSISPSAHLHFRDSYKELEEGSADLIVMTD